MAMLAVSLAETTANNNYLNSLLHMCMQLKVRLMTLLTFPPPPNLPPAEQFSRQELCFLTSQHSCQGHRHETLPLWICQCIMTHC